MTTPTLQTRLGYVALMICGVGLMLLAVAGREADKDRVATFVGLGFVVLGIVLLVTAGGWDLYRRLFRVRESEPAATETAQSSTNTEVVELTDTERALIQLLRTSDVPPDLVAEAICEAMEKRMGR